MKKIMAAIALLGLIALLAPLPGTIATNSLSSTSRKMLSVGPDDLAAVAAVGDAAVAAGMSMKYASKKIAIAKAKEAHAVAHADRKVAKEMYQAYKHKQMFADNPAKLMKFAAKDAEDIADAIADAKAAKMKAKLRSCHIVAKSMAKVAEINLKYGGQAALAVGNAALNDVATFVPFLAPLASKVLPDLAQGFAAGPQGIQNALGGLASAIGGALVGNLGLEGPDVLAGRVADLLPGNLLNSLNDMEVDVPGGGVQNLINSVPPEVLNLMMGFLGGNNGPLNPTPAFAPNPSDSLFGRGPNLPNIVEDIISVPGNALRAITQGVLGVMTQGGGPIHLPNLDLDHLPAAGLPFPIKQLNNLLSVLPKPDLLNVFKMLPMPPLAGLLSHLPIALEINH